MLNSIDNNTDPQRVTQPNLTEFRSSSKSEEGQQSRSPSSDVIDGFDNIWGPCSFLSKFVESGVDYDYVRRLELEALKREMAAMKLALSDFIDDLKTDQEALRTLMFDFEFIR